MDSRWTRWASAGGVYILTLWILVTLPDTCGAQTTVVRDFPPLFDVGRFRRLTTQPAQATCGIPTRNAYCKSSTFAASIEECRQAYCVQECPRRTSLPPHTNLLAAINYGPCVTTDGVNVHPGSSMTDFSAVFQEGTACYIVPYSKPVLGANAAFTVTFWIWQNKDNQG